MLLISLRERFALLIFFILGFALGAHAEAPSERRLMRVESRLYGWYGVVEPAFDKTVGRRQLYKISNGEKFLNGLAGRLVILEGQFQEGQLDLGSLAPPPISVPENARRQRFVIDRSLTKDGELTSLDGFRLRTEDPALLAPATGQWKADLVVVPLGDNRLDVNAVLSLAEAPAAAPIVVAPVNSANLMSPNSGPMVDLEMTQAFLDNLIDLGRDQAGLKVQWQALSLKASQLRLILPDQVAANAAPWRLEGTVELGMAQGGATLADSSFVVSARPVISNNLLILEPDWDQIQLEGQLPFNFLLDASMLRQLKAFLPKQLTVLNLDWVNSYLRAQSLLDPEEKPQWFLAPSPPSTLRLGAGDNTTAVTPSTRALTPGNFRLQLSAALADRLVRRGVQSVLDPDTPFVPDPPIQVGKALFVAITVQKIFLRSLESGYSQGVFRFQNLVVDVAWKAGPLNGIEPLLQAAGFVRPRLSPPTTPGGPRYWDWDVKIEQLVIRSDKLPGDKTELAADLTPRLEQELGSTLARKQQIPARLPLSNVLKGGAGDGLALDIVDLRPLDASLEFEGRLLKI